MVSQFFNIREFPLIQPEAELALFGVAILLIDTFLEKREKWFNAITALIGVGFSTLTLVGMPDFLIRNLQGFAGGRFAIRGLMGLMRDAEKTSPDFGGFPGFNGTILVDHFFIFFSLIFLAAAALVILLSVHYLEIEDEHHGEYYALMLFATVGMMFMASGVDLIVQFLGLETMAISFYILAGFLRRERRSNEGAMKYLLLGAFSSGLLAYGFSILFGLTASTNLFEIASVLARSYKPDDMLVFLAFVTIAAGLFFKVAAVPFHQWAPDVYEGAPTPITAYVSVASKTASFALLLRILYYVFEPSKSVWLVLVAGVAVASMTVGNLAAITQSNVKRLLAYSSISHVGYILLGVVAAYSPEDGLNPTALKGIAFYLLVYAFMNTGAFAIVILLRHKGLIGDELEDLNGLYQRSPGAAVLLLIFMLSLAGIPPTAGFLGKYYIFLALIETKHYWLAVFGVLYVVPALYYYFRLVKHAWLTEPADPIRLRVTFGQAIALAATILITLGAGIYPEPFARLASFAFALGR